MLKIKPLLMAAIMILATMTATPTLAAEEAADFPKPGERLADKSNWGTTELVMNEDDGVQIIIHDSLEVLAEIKRYEVIIVGDTVEFCAKDAVLTYQNGEKTYPVHEVFADGERLVFYVDHAQKSMAELYVPLKQVVGTVDTSLYSMVIVQDGNRGAGLSGWLSFPVDASLDSPYKMTRQAPKDAKSAKDILIPSPTSKIPLSTVPIEQPEQKPAETTKPAGQSK